MLGRKWLQTRLNKKNDILDAVIIFTPHDEQAAGVTELVRHYLDQLTVKVKVVNADSDKVKLADLL